MVLVDPFALKEAIRNKTCVRCCATKIASLSLRRPESAQPGLFTNR